MDGQRVAVRHVVGRYPHQPQRFDSNNIETAVQEESRMVRIRIDDTEHSDFYMEIVLEVDA